MVLKRSFIGDIMEDSALHIHSSGLLGDRAHPFNIIVLPRRWSWKVPFLSYTGENFVYSLFIYPRAELPEMVWWSWKDCFQTVSMLGGCGGLERTGFLKIWLQYGVVVLKALILTIDSTWCQCWHQWGVTWKKYHVALCFDCFNLTNAIVSLTEQQVMLTPVPVMTLHNQRSHATHHFMFYIIMLWMQWWHWHHIMPTQVLRVPFELESHVAPHFNCLELRNAVVPLTISLVPHDANTNANSVIWPKMSCWPLVLLSWPKNCNDAFGIMCCQCLLCHVTKKSWCISFQCLRPNKCSGATDDAISIIWCQCHL